MRQLKNCILILMIMILLFISCPNLVFAANDNNLTKDINVSDVKTSSKACLLMDAKTGQIIYSKNAHEVMYPASTTKIMTAILALEHCKLSDVATVSHNAIFSIPVGYSHANLQEGEELTIEQLLNVLMIPSANDSAVVIAEHIEGSVEEFSKLMNAKAKELGCLNTNFINPNGIHHKEHVSTAYDLALIGKYAMKFPDIMRIAMVRQYTLPTTNKYDKTNRIFNATNGLINSESLNKNYYEYATGLKTGYTDSSGYCIVSTAKKDDRELLAVILKSKSIDARYSDCKNLFEYGFNSYEYKTLKASGDIVQTVEIPNGTNSSKNLGVSVKDEIRVLLKKDTDIEKLEPQIEIESDLLAPLAENKVIGKITYTIDGTAYSSDLVAGNSVFPSSIETIIFRVLLLFLILYILYRLLKMSSNNKPKSSDKKSSSKKKVYKKSKNKANKYKKFENMDEDIHIFHNRNGKGKIKYTQISNFL